MDVIVIEKDDIKLFIHVGMPKCATKWIQKNVYAQAKKLHNVNYRRRIDLENKVYSDRINIFSSEGFYGDYSNIFKGRKTGYIQEDNIKVLLRIKRAFPYCKIIFGYRNIDDWIVSMYKQYVRKGGFYSFDDYLSDIKENYSYLLDVDMYINVIKSWWNSKDFFIYNYDNYKDEHMHYLAHELQQFLGISGIIVSNKKINKSNSDFKTKLLLKKNKIKNVLKD